MEKRFLLLWQAIALSFSILLISACDRTIDTRPVPADTDPGIALEHPSTNNLLRTIGSTVDLTLRLVDNEALKLMRVTESVISPDGDTLLWESYKEDIPVSGTVMLQPYNYSVTNSVQGVPIENYSKIRLNFFSVDTKGAGSSTQVIVNVIPDPLGPPAYMLHSYSANRMLHPNSLRGKERFNFTSLLNPPDRPGTFDSLNLDVMIINQLPGPIEGKSFNSPANIYFGNDSVFVLTDASRFNYEECNYRTIAQAYFSDPLPSPEVLIPKVGDMLIVSLTKGQGQHFAVMKITEFGRDPQNGNAEYVQFDHKVTY